MLNPYVLLALFIGWGASVGGAFFYGRGVGADSEIATQARVAHARTEVIAAVDQAVAKNLGSIQVKNTTIRQTLEKEVYERPVYRDCVADPAARRLLNDTIGAAAPASAPGGGELSASQPTR